MNQDACATFPWFDGEYDLSFAVMCFCPLDPPVSNMFFRAQIMYLNPPRGYQEPWIDIPSSMTHMPRNLKDAEALVPLFCGLCQAVACVHACRQAGRQACTPTLACTCTQGVCTCKCGQAFLLYSTDTSRKNGLRQSV